MTADLGGCQFHRANTCIATEQPISIATKQATAFTASERRGAHLLLLLHRVALAGVFIVRGTALMADVMRLALQSQCGDTDWWYFGFNSFRAGAIGAIGKTKTFPPSNLLEGPMAQMAPIEPWRDGR